MRKHGAEALKPKVYKGLERYVFYTFYTLHKLSNLRKRENSVTIQLCASLSTVFVVFCYGGARCFLPVLLERRSANDREGAHLSLCFRYSQQ